MSLVDHLYELRYRLGVALVAIVAGGILGFVWFAHSIFGLPTLSEFVTGPYCALPAEVRFSPNEAGCQLLQTKPFEAFMIQLKVGLSLGVVLLSPVWLYQLWAFITPGLHVKERSFARVFVAVGSGLFLAGASLAYFVAPKGLAFMVSFGGGAFFTALTGGEYINFVLLMLLFFGISFELPLLVVMLNRAGVVSYAQLKSWWRGIVFVLFCFAAIATPGQDPISMVVLAAALTVLYGVAMLLCRRHDRVKARKLAEHGLESVGLDDASPLDHQASELDMTPSAQRTDHEETT